MVVEAGRARCTGPMNEHGAADEMTRDAGAGGLAMVVIQGG